MKNFGQGAGVLSNAALVELFSAFDKTHLGLSLESKASRRIISTKSM
jgi:hypothetical protein